MIGPFIWLDRINEILVRARLAGRQPVPVRWALERRLEAAPLAVDVELEPRRIEGFAGRRSERWEDPRRGWHGRRWVPSRPGVGRPAVVFLHPWLATPAHLQLYRWLSGPLRRRGVELWVPTLPEHMERAEPGRVSGERCVSADLVRTSRSIRRGVAETVALVRWLRARGAGRVCLWGVSLGGWVGGLTATVASELDGVVLWEPVADPGATLRRSDLAADVREALRRGGIPDELLGTVLETLSPAARSLRVARERVLLIAGRQDTVVPAVTVRRLAARWGVATIWLEHAHIGLAASPSARRPSTAFLSRCLEVTDA